MFSNFDWEINRTDMKVSVVCRCSVISVCRPIRTDGHTEYSQGLCMWEGCLTVHRV